MDFAVKRKEYEEIYDTSYQAIKKSNPNFVVTGPGCIGSSQYLEWFLDMCDRRGCMPDVITFRSYAEGEAHDEDGLNLISNNESFPMVVSKDENLIRNTTDKIKHVLNDRRINYIKIEWAIGSLQII